MDSKKVGLVAGVFDLFIAIIISFSLMKSVESFYALFAILLLIETGLLMSRFVFFFRRGQGLYSTRTVAYCLFVTSSILFVIN